MKNKILVPAAALLVLLGLFYLLAAYQTPILMYHSIGLDSCENKLCVSPSSFDRQMKFLAKSGYKPLRFSDYIEYRKKGRRPPWGSVVVTFDYGYADNYTYAYPILKKNKVPTAIFMAEALVGTEGMLSEEQLREMDKDDLVEIGSHGLGIPLLAESDWETMRQNLLNAHARLEEILNKKVKFFCYSGTYSKQEKKLIRSARFEAACATQDVEKSELNDLYAVQRIRISRSSDSLVDFWFRVSGYYNFFRNRN